MLKLVRRILLVGLALSVVVACEKEDLNDTKVFEEVSLNYSSFEIEVMDLVNNYRSELGLPKLAQLNLVSNEAENHTIYMVEQDVLSHDNFEIRTQNLIINLDALSVGENVAYGYQTAEGLFNGWLNSPSHRSTIETKRYTNFGISAQKNIEGNYYVTQIFIER